MRSGSDRAKKIEDTLMLADEQLSFFKLADAFSTYSDVLELTNKYPRINIALTRAHIGRGDVYLNYGEFDSAIKCYQQAFLLDPNSSDDRRSYIIKAYLKCVDACLRRGDPNAAVDYFIEIFILDPNHKYARVALSEQKHHQHPLFPAVVKLLEHPRDESAHIALMSYFFNSKQFDKSLFCAERFLEINPKCKQALLIVAELNINLDDDKVIQCCAKVIEQDRDCLLAYVMRAGIYMERESFQLAAVDLMMALNIDVNSLYDEMELDKTIEYAQIISIYFPFDPEPYYLFGKALYAQGDMTDDTNEKQKLYDMAFDKFKYAVGKGKKYFPALMVLANLYEQRKHYDYALKYYSKAYRINSDEKAKCGMERTKSMLIEQPAYNHSVLAVGVFSGSHANSLSNPSAFTASGTPKKNF